MTTAAPVKEKNEFAVMDQTGDTKTMWDPDNEDEVEIARNTFDKLKKKGYLIYRTDKKGGTGEVMTKFDPDAARLVAVPPIVGG